MEKTKYITIGFTRDEAVELLGLTNYEVWQCDDGMWVAASLLAIATAKDFAPGDIVDEEQRTILGLRAMEQLDWGSFDES